MNTIDIGLAHGETMYRLALAHAINILELDPDNGLQFLKDKLASLEKEDSDVSP